jgi:hypothetical protein
MIAYRTAEGMDARGPGRPVLVEKTTHPVAFSTRSRLSR